MAARRKRSDRDASGSWRAVGVLLEDMRGQFRAFGEALSVLDDKVTALDGKVAALDGKVAALDGKVAALDGKVAALDSRVTALDVRMTAGFARVDQRLDRVEHELGLVKSAVLEHGRLLKQKVNRDEVEAIVERAIARKT